MNILVSAVGSDIGFGAARILKEWGVFNRLYGIDIHKEHPGNFILDECFVAPRASDSNYIPWLANFIEKYKITAFLPSSEAEIKVLSSLGVTYLTGAKIIINNQFTVSTALDKFKCLQYLASYGIAVPENGIVGETLPTSYPVIVKPREGQGSKGIFIANELAELPSSTTGDLVWQKYLIPIDQEYTCPVYSSQKIGLRSLIVKRKLLGGLTGSGVIVDNIDIDEYIRQIADVMKLEGAMNIQLRLTAEGPLVFEINPRMSSTLVFRDKMGFCDLRWWIANELNMSSSAYTPPKAGSFFYRGSQEYISSI